MAEKKRARTVRGSLVEAAEKLVANKHLQVAARTRSSVDSALGLARHQDETPAPGV